jgi:uncharacterized protein (TIGR01777 family)
MNQKTVLVTGASGMVASKLIDLLLQKGYRVNTLSRKPNQRKDVQSFLWNLDSKSIDEQAILSANFIIHLAGESVAAERWTLSRKKKILDSRIDSTKLLMSVLKKHNHCLDGYIGASAIGFYGDRGTEALTETSVAKKCFLSDVCIEWEQAHQQISDYTKRLVIFRIGVVLDKNEGALKEMMKAFPLSLNYLGDGKQSTSFIALDDLAKMLVFSVEDSTINGTYNAVGPEVLSNKQLISTLSRFKKPLLPITSVPAFLLKAIMGEAAVIALYSQNCSAEKILSTGFVFDFPHLDLVFQHLFKKS